MSNDNDLTKLISTMDSMQKIFQNCAAIQAAVLQPIQALHQTFVNSINAIAGISNRIQRTYEEVYKPKEGAEQFRKIIDNYISKL